MYSYETVGKGASIIRMSAVGNYSTNTIMKQWKKETGGGGGGGGGGGVKNIEFLGVFKKRQVDFPGFN